MTSVKLGNLIFILVAVIVITSKNCQAKTRILYLDTYINCDKTFEVRREDEVVLEEEEKYFISTRALPQCTLTFKAEDVDGRLCVQVLRLTFKNCNIELKLHNSLTVTKEETKTFTCNNTVGLPVEWCTSDRYMMLQLFTQAKHPSVKDLDLVAVIRHISNSKQKRTVYLDSACGGVYPLQESSITVKNRQHGGTEDLPQNCSATFEYIGQDKNYTACLTYMSHVSQCAYTLHVFDGNNESHIYSCKQQNPHRWCSTSGRITLTMIRKDLSRVAEPDNSFVLRVMDELPEGYPSHMSVLSIIGFSVVAILVLAAAILCFVLLYRHRNKEPPPIEIPAPTRPANGVVSIPLINNTHIPRTEEVELQRLNHPA